MAPLRPNRPLRETPMTTMATSPKTTKRTVENQKRIYHFGARQTDGHGEMFEPAVYGDEKTQRGQQSGKLGKRCRRR